MSRLHIHRAHVENVCLLLCVRTKETKIHILTLTCGAVYQSRKFWWKLPSFGHIGCRDFCLLSDIMGLNVALLVVLTAPEEFHVGTTFSLTELLL